MALEIRICIDSVTAEFVKCKEDKEDTFTKDNNHIKNQVITSGTPYIWRREYSDSYTSPTNEQQSIVRQFDLLPAQSRRNIAYMLRDFGSETLMAISDFQNQVMPFLSENTHGIVGSGATSIEARSSKFANYANKYEAALRDIRMAHKSGMPKYHMVALEQKAFSIFKELNGQFRTELQRFMSVNRASRRGSVWSNPNRGINIAKSARHSAKLDISSTAEFNKIKRIENTGRWLGNGMILLDGAFRANKVYNDYKNNKDWQRSLSTELASFGASTALGIYTGTVLTTALSSVLILTPYGWVVAIGLSVIAGLTASIQMNKFSKKVSENIYDRKPILEGAF